MIYRCEVCGETDGMHADDPHLLQDQYAADATEPPPFEPGDKPW